MVMASTEVSEITKGCTLRVIRGKKYAYGTEGVCFWVGQTRFGRSVGFHLPGSKTPNWVDASNVERIQPRAHITIEPVKTVPVSEPIKVTSAMVSTPTPEFKPVREAKRPYPWVRKASDADLAWEPEHARALPCS